MLKSSNWYRVRFVPPMAVICLAFASAGHATTIVTFQEGVSGYAGTQDATIKSLDPDTNFGILASVESQFFVGTPPCCFRYGLLRFDSIVGTDTGQIPAGANILRAELNVESFDTTSGQFAFDATVHEALTAWDEATLTWNNFGATPGAQASTDYISTSLATISLGLAGPRSIDVTASIQSIANGSQNLGWLFRGTLTNVGVFLSSEHATMTARPKLTVHYDVLPVPDADGDGVPDTDDNCTLVPNGTTIPDAGGNSQLDSNGDGFGNICDADFNGDLVINGSDVGPFVTQFGTSGPDADLNGDGVVNGLDVGPFVDMFGNAPGPSGQVP